MSNRINRIFVTIDLIKCDEKSLCQGWHESAMATDLFCGVLYVPRYSTAHCVYLYLSLSNSLSLSLSLSFFLSFSFAHSFLSVLIDPILRQPNETSDREKEIRKKGISGPLLNLR
jgi:hypothetical protein